MKHSPWPALCLFLASPLIGEYLLGSLPASMIFLLPLMAARAKVDLVHSLRHRLAAHVGGRDHVVDQELLVLRGGQALNTLGQFTAGFGWVNTASVFAPARQGVIVGRFIF